MYALLCGAALNVVLDPIMIYVLHLGVIGAAIATAISQVVSFLVYLTYILNKKVCFPSTFMNIVLAMELCLKY